MKISYGDIIKEAKNIDQATEIIKDYEDTVTNDKKVVSHYLVDGVEIADIYAFLEGGEHEEIQNVVIVAQTIPEMIRESVFTFLDYLPGLQKGLLSMKERLIIGEAISEESWLAILDGLEWTNQLMTNLSSLVAFEQERLAELTVRWKQQLGEMASSWEIGDTVLMADIFEYEILEVLEELEAYFQMYLSQGEEH